MDGIRAAWIQALSILRRRYAGPSVCSGKGESKRHPGEPPDTTTLPLCWYGPWFSPNEASSCGASVIAFCMARPGMSTRNSLQTFVHAANICCHEPVYWISGQSVPHNVQHLDTSHSLDAYSHARTWRRQARPGARRPKGMSWRRLHQRRQHSGGSLRRYEGPYLHLQPRSLLRTKSSVRGRRLPVRGVLAHARRGAGCNGTIRG